MAQNSEARNVGYEAHPMFPVYKENLWMEWSRCCSCGNDSPNTYTKGEGPDSEVYCGECSQVFESDVCYFVEWCETHGFNADRVDVLEIASNTTMDMVTELLSSMIGTEKQIIIETVEE